MNKLLITFTALLIGLTLGSANAQKLPNVQPASVYAPADIKVDGKPKEWTKLQAYNRATNVYYTLSNDEENLYLTVQADDQSVINKILRGGITFMVNTAGKKADKGGISVTYPIYDKDRPRIIFRNKPEIIAGNEASVKRADSFMYANNKLLADKSKNIMTSGMKNVDSLISVYNEDGIKVAQAFDNKMIYTCEFAISLKHFGLAAGNLQKFAYNFKLNGINIDELMKNVTITQGPDGSVTGVSVGKPMSGTGSVSLTAAGGSGVITHMSVDGNGDGLQSLTSPTDFWGEYTLAKK